MSLIYGTARLPRVVEDSEAFLLAYRDDTGADYLYFEPVTPVDVLYPEDLAVTILVDSRVGPRAYLDGPTGIRGQGIGDRQLCIPVWEDVMGRPLPLLGDGLTTRLQRLHPPPMS